MLLPYFAWVLKGKTCSGVQRPGLYADCITGVLLFSLSGVYLIIERLLIA